MKYEHFRMLAWHVRLCGGGCLLAAALWVLPTSAQPGSSFSQARSLEVGDPVIEPERVRPYRGRWRYLRLDVEGAEQQLGVFIEDLQRIEAGGVSLLQRRRQRLYHTPVRGRTPGLYDEVITFDASTLAPLHRAEATPEGDLSVKSWQGPMSWTVRNGNPEPVIFRADRLEFSLAAQGIVLQALPLRDGFAARLPLEAYWIDARVVGTDLVDVGEREPVEAWVVDTTWMSMTDSESVFPGGADGSGGTSYVLKVVPDGVAPLVKVAWTDELGPQAIVMRDGLLIDDAESSVDHGRALLRRQPAVR